VSGSKRSPIPIHDRVGPRSLGAETVAFGYLRKRCFLNSGSEKTFGYPRHAPSLVTASGGLSHTKVAAGAFVPTSGGRWMVPIAEHQYPNDR
jgi:hypothetical protein